MHKIEENDRLFDLYIDGHYGNIFKASELTCKFCDSKPVKYYYDISVELTFACERHKGHLEDEENERDRLDREWLQAERGCAMY